MIILINGSFGIGKSTVARLLRRRVPRSVVYNPEWAGSILMRLPRWVKLRGAGTDDFQDIDLWRMSVITGVRLFQSVTSGAVIVPMAFSRREYFDESCGGAEIARLGCPRVLPSIGYGDDLAAAPGPEPARPRRRCCVEHRKGTHVWHHTKMSTSGSR